jgi:uncharacterized membrane protein
MRIRDYIFAIIAVVVAISSAAITYSLLAAAFRSIQGWYSRKFIQPVDPDATWPPLMFVVILILPMFASALGGALAGCIYRTRSWIFAIVIGVALAVSWSVSFWRFSSLDLPIAIAAMTIGIMGSLGYFLSQRRRKPSGELKLLKNQP